RSVGCEDVVSGLAVKVEEGVRLVAGLSARADGEPVGTDRPEEDRAEAEADVLVDNLDRVVEREPGGRHECGDAAQAENVAGTLDVLDRELVAVAARPGSVRVVEEGWAVEGGRDGDALVGEVGEP